MKGGSEDALVRVLEGVFGGRASRRAAEVGIGDDAAVLRPARGAWVWTVDVQVEGVHFLRPWLTFEQLGARAFHAAVSDLAAMGARPVAALSSLVVPRTLGDRAIREIAVGQERAAEELCCPVVGGNLSRGAELSVTTTALGVARRPLLRSAAREGDEIWLVGDVGLAAAGLASLRGGRDRTKRRAVRVREKASVAEQRALRVCEEAWRAPCARVREGMRLAGRARAAIDVSDGLAGEARHLAEASRVRCVLEEVALAACLRPELDVAAPLLRRAPLDLALYGGEDHALVATGPGRKRPTFARRIGRVEKGRGAVIETASGRVRVLGKGFDHFG